MSSLQRPHRHHRIGLSSISQPAPVWGTAPLQSICTDIIKTQHHLPRLVKPDYAGFEIH